MIRISSLPLGHLLVVGEGQRPVYPLYPVYIRPAKTQIQASPGDHHRGRRERWEIGQYLAALYTRKDCLSKIPKPSMVVKAGTDHVRVKQRCQMQLGCVTVGNRAVIH